MEKCNPLPGNVSSSWCRAWPWRGWDGPPGAVGGLRWESTMASMLPCCGILVYSCWILASNRGHPQFTNDSVVDHFVLQIFRLLDFIRHVSALLIDFKVLLTFCPLVVLWVVLSSSISSWLWTSDHSRNILVNSHCLHGHTWCRLEKNLALWCHLHWAQCRLMCEVADLMSVLRLRIGTCRWGSQHEALEAFACRSFQVEEDWDWNGLDWVAPWPLNGHDITEAMIPYDGRFIASFRTWGNTPHAMGVVRLRHSENLE